MRAWFVCLFILIGQAGLADVCRHDALQIRADSSDNSSVVRFNIEVADTPEARAQGLMFRESLAKSAGMLFVYPEPQQVAFWMRNTLIPLDMIFIDARGVVQRVHSNAIPHDETPIPGGTEILAVLEINGGLARKLKITPGSQVRHPAFEKTGAFWSC